MGAPRPFRNLQANHGVFHQALSVAGASGRLCRRRPPAARSRRRCKRPHPLFASPLQGEDPTARINSISFHRTSDLLVSAADDDSIRLYNTQTGLEDR